MYIIKLKENQSIMKELIHKKERRKNIKWVGQIEIVKGKYEPKYVRQYI